VAGFIYLLTNEAMPGLVKIGKTGSPDPQTRIRQLSNSTGVPEPFVCELLVRFADADTVERLLHKTLDPVRSNRRREFFRIDLDAVTALVKAISGGEIMSVDAPQALNRTSKRSPETRRRATRNQTLSKRSTGTKAIEPRARPDCLARPGQPKAAPTKTPRATAYRHWCGIPSAAELQRKTRRRERAFAAVWASGMICLLALFITMLEGWKPTAQAVEALHWTGCGHSTIGGQTAERWAAGLHEYAESLRAAATAKPNTRLARAADDDHPKTLIEYLNALPDRQVSCDKAQHSAEHEVASQNGWSIHTNLTSLLAALGFRPRPTDGPINRYLRSPELFVDPES